MPRHLLLALGLLAAALWLGAAPAVAADPAHPEPAAAGGAGHAAPAANPNILELRPSLALSTLIVFLVLLAVLWKFAWGPLSKALADRERSQEEMVRQAEHARAESERLLAEHRAQMAQAAEQVRSLHDEARRNAQSIADDIVRKAQAEAEASRDRARREVETARDQALVEIWSQAADVAVSVAGKVLSREMDEGDRRRLVDAATAALPDRPTGRNGHGA